MGENKARIEAIRLLAEQEGYELVKKVIKSCLHCKNHDLDIGSRPCRNCNEDFDKFEPEEVNN